GVLAKNGPHLGRTTPRASPAIPASTTVYCFLDRMSSDNGPIAGRDFHFQEVVAFSVRYYPFEIAAT
ncbi:hypothetical protein K0M31_019333, partial [Melipona bicolor]